jgi:hypothetical protein
VKFTQAETGPPAPPQGSTGTLYETYELYLDGKLLGTADLQLPVYTPSALTATMELYELVGGDRAVLEQRTNHFEVNSEFKTVKISEEKDPKHIVPKGVTGSGFPGVFRFGETPLG